ncbi:MAG: SBBP repeat-containing protein [Candidatus Cloacimonas sp.]
MGDIFVAKLDSNGNWLWAKKVGGTSNDLGKSIAVDSNGNSYITGYFNGIATFGTATLTSSGGDDIFVAKLDSSGNWLWAKKAGGTGTDEGNGIAVDANGNSYVTGYFGGRSATFGNTILTSSSMFFFDIFIAKLDSKGNWLWAKKVGGENDKEVKCIAVDAKGNSYVTGNFEGSAIIGTTNLTSNGWAPDIFVAKLDRNGNWLWAKQAGGTSKDYGYSIVVDVKGNSYVTGSFDSSNITFGTITLTSSGYGGIFVAKIDSNGNWLWAKQAEGKVCSIAVDANGNSYITGNFGNSPTFGTTELKSSDGSDIFISKIGLPVYQVLVPNGGEQWRTGSTMTVYWNSNISNIGNYINIQLSFDNGVNWIIMNSSPVEATLGNFSFTVPYVNSNQCLIKIINADNSNCFDISDETFTISSSVPYSLSLTVPNYSKLQAGRNYTINWTVSGINMVNLAYSCDAGVTWNSIASALPANLGTYEWTVPNISASTCYLKVSDSAQPAIYDWSDQAFSICKLQLLSPNGGEIWGTKSRKNISWSENYISNLKLEYSSDKGNSWITIANDIFADYYSGSFSWYLPDINSSQYLIRISDADDNTIWDVSDNPFTIRPYIIVIAPNGNEYLTVNSIYAILWSITAEVSTVVIDYSIDGGKNWLPVQTSPINAAIGKYDWLVPNNPSKNCLIKVCNTADRDIYDVSDKVFTIIPLN